MTSAAGDTELGNPFNTQGNEAARGDAETAQAASAGGATAGGAVERQTNFRKLKFFIFAFVVFWIVYVLPLRLGQEEHKCLAMLIFVCILWATDAIPLFVTSLCIPLMIVLFDIVLNVDGEPMPSSQAAARELAKIADPNVILLMGGFTIAAALHKYGIDVRIATRIQNLVGGGAPRLFILANMVIGFVLSMFCNNVAAPVVTFMLVTPVLHRVDDRNYCQCMVMAVAFACNIGGMPTPIASPQNAQALKVIEDTLKQEVGFLGWMEFALPICIVLLPITWAWLIFWFRPELESIPAGRIQTPNSIGLVRQFSRLNADEPWSHWHTYVVAVTVLTVLLWCIFDLFKGIFGSMGVVGLIPVICIYGPGILSKEDLKGMDWSTLLLLGGGAALGDAVQSSGLLETLGKSLLSGFRSGGLGVYAQFMIFNLVILFVANFISHTVAAITMLGVVAEVGSAVNKGMAFVLGGVICDSGACALPVSSFPNLFASSVKDKNGETYLSVSDYLIPALGVELVVLFTMSTLGWLLA